MDKNSGLSHRIFHEDKLIKIKDNLSKHSLNDFNVGLTVTLKSGGPDMWILAIHGEKIECGWILNNNSHSEIFTYRCLSIKRN